VAANANGLEVDADRNTGDCTNWLVAAGARPRRVFSSFIVILNRSLPVWPLPQAAANVPGAQSGEYSTPVCGHCNCLLGVGRLEGFTECAAPYLNQGEDVSRIGLVLISQRDAVVLKSELVDHDIRERRQREPHHPGLVVG
jgi:hypothetical protein